MISINGVSYSYKRSEEEQLNTTSMEIGKGEVILLCGKSGSGKSTFINLLMGLTRGTGEVFYNGVKVKKRCENIFAIMQDVNYQLFTESVWQEISTITKEDELKNEILRMVDLFDKKEMHPNSLSGGEKQRLLLAMSMLSRKPIVIFDEPTSGLCKRQMDILIVFLNKMTEQGKIIIIITHDYEFIDRCNGKVYEFVK